jgi:hypothetical protein
MVRSNINECPNCHSNMTLTKAPYIYHGSYIGMFRAYTCNFCNRVYFTEDAYHEIMGVPTSLKDFTPFVEQKPILIKQKEVPRPFLELQSESDSHKNKKLVSINEEDLIIS